MNYKIKYNRISSLSQSGDRFSLDTKEYDFTFLDKSSGTTKFAERKYGKEVIEMVEAGKVAELEVAEISRLGRNTADCLGTLQFLDKHNVNVRIQNIGLQSIQEGGQKNPIFTLITGIVSSLAEQELLTLKERITAGREIYRLKGGTFGRKKGDCLTELEFMSKPQVKKIILQLEKGQSIRNTAKIVEVSPMLVQKTKKILQKQKVSLGNKVALKVAPLS